jgi:hypothetical protein
LDEIRQISFGHTEILLNLRNIQLVHESLVGIDSVKVLTKVFLLEEIVHNSLSPLSMVIVYE